MILHNSEVFKISMEIRQNEFRGIYFLCWYYTIYNDKYLEYQSKIAISAW